MKATAVLEVETFKAATASSRAGADANLPDAPGRSAPDAARIGGID